MAPVKRLRRRGRKIPIPKTLGGFLPLLPLLGLLPGLAGAGAAIAGTALRARAQRKALDEAQRHNKAMEAAILAKGKGLKRRRKKRGSGIKKKKRRGRGIQLYPWSPATPWLIRQSKRPSLRTARGTGLAVRRSSPWLTGAVKKKSSAISRRGR